MSACRVNLIQITDVSVPSSRFGHPSHPHGGELHRGARHRHTHTQSGPHGEGWRPGDGAHAAVAGQGQGLRGTPAQEP